MKGVYPWSRSAEATCICCARVVIPVSWSMMAKPASRGSMPVMRCSLLGQAAGPLRCRSVSRTDRSSGKRPLRRSMRGAIVLLESAVPHRHCRWVRWSSQVPWVCRGHGVWGAPSQRGPQGGQGGQSRGYGSFFGCTARPLVRSGCLLLAFCVAGRLGQGAPGVRGMTSLPSLG